MILGRVMLSAVITLVIRPWVPVVTIVFLGFVASNTPEKHVHLFHVADNNGVVGDSNCSEVVGLDGVLGLWPSHFNKSLTHGRHRLGSDEQACEFCFGGRRHDKLDDLGDGEDWAVESRESVVF